MKFLAFNTKWINWLEEWHNFPLNLCLNFVSTLIETDVFKLQILWKYIHKVKNVKVGWWKQNLNLMFIQKR